jgi:hypothetical protein
MAKKLGLLMAAVAVLAFAIPSMAMAEQEITKTAGVTAAVGTEITGTGADLTLKSSTLGNITCKKITLKGKITVNGGGKFAGSGTEEKPPAEDCTNGVKEVNVTSVKLTDLHSTGAGLGVVSFVATVDIGTGESAQECTFTGKEIKGTYTEGKFEKEAGGALVFTEAESTGITSVPALCGTAKLIGSVQLELTVGGAPIVLDK